MTQGQSYLIREVTLLSCTNALVSTNTFGTGADMNEISWDGKYIYICPLPCKIYRKEEGCEGLASPEEEIYLDF